MKNNGTLKQALEYISKNRGRQISLMDEEDIRKFASGTDDISVSHSAASEVVEQATFGVPYLNDNVCTVIRNVRGDIRVPVLTDDSTYTEVAEGAEASVSNPSVEARLLKNRKVSAISNLTNELIENSDIASVRSGAISLMTRGMNKLLDMKLALEDADGINDGLITALIDDGASSTTAISSIDYGDFKALVDDMDARLRGSAVIITSSKAANDLAKNSSSNRFATGRELETLDRHIVGYYLGIPIYISSAFGVEADDPIALIGNTKMFWTRVTDVRISVADEEETAFLNDSVAVKTSVYFDGALTTNGQSGDKEMALLVGA